MGMKVSALTLGWKYTIVTKSINEPNIQHVFEFDSTMLKDENSGYLSELEILTSSDPIASSHLDKFASGTSILIEQLTNKGKVLSVATLKDQLTQQFWPQIENLQKQDKLNFKIIAGYDETIENTYVVTKILRPAFEHDVLKLDFEKPNFEKHWSKKEKYEYVGSDGNVHQLKGFIQLLEKRDFTGNYGINVYINNQLVCMFEKESFNIVGRTYEKIYGEIDLTGAVAGNVKNAIQNDDGFKNVIKLINDDLQGIYKKLGTPSGKAANYIHEEIQKRLQQEILKEDGTQKKKKEKEKENTVFPAGMPDNVVKISDTIYYHIRHKPSVKNDLEYAWKALPAKSDLKFDDCQLFELFVRVNKNSAFFKALEGQMQGRDLKNIEAFFNKVAICESLLEIIKDNHSIKNARAIIDKNVYPAVIKMKI